jgi:hypothetical protein
MTSGPSRRVFVAALTLRHDPVETLFSIGAIVPAADRWRE